MITGVVLYSWPLVMLVLFRRLSVPVAVAVSIVGGYLLLPTRPVLNLPVLPTIYKDTLPAFAAVLLAMIFAPAPGRTGAGPAAAGILPGWLPRSGISRILLLMLFGGAFLTVFTNSDRLVYGEKVLPGLELYTGFSAALTAIMMLLPFVLARKFLSNDAGHRTLLWVLGIAGLLYSIPVAYEIRMSPQLNRMIYGYFPGSWAQTVRGDGFRPTVFLEHGLWLAIFMAGAFLAVLGLMRLSSGVTRTRLLIAAVWLLMILLLSRSLGALVIGLWGAMVALFLPVRGQLLMAGVITGIILTYPVLRGAGLVPVDTFVALAGKVSEQRANSLDYRLYNEDILLEKANKRPLAGWGGFGRNRVFDDEGRDASTTDGLWTIIIGKYGWIGYIAQFGLLGLPVILLAIRRRTFEVGYATSFLAIILAANMIDLIPNATLTPVTWLIAGALMGRLEWTAAPARALRAAHGAAPPPAPLSGGSAPAEEGRVSPQYSARHTRQKYLHERSGS